MTPTCANVGRHTLQFTACVLQTHALRPKTTQPAGLPRTVCRRHPSTTSADLGRGNLSCLECRAPSHGIGTTLVETNHTVSEWGAPRSVAAGQAPWPCGGERQGRAMWRTATWGGTAPGVSRLVGGAFLLCREAWEAKVANDGGGCADARRSEDGTAVTHGSIRVAQQCLHRQTLAMTSTGSLRYAFVVATRLSDCLWSGWHGAGTTKRTATRAGGGGGDHRSVSCSSRPPRAVWWLLDGRYSSPEPERSPQDTELRGRGPTAGCHCAGTESTGM